MNTVFLDADSMGEQISISALSAHCANWQSYPNSRQDQIVSRCANAEVIVCNKVKLDRNTLDQLPNLRAILVSATGYDNIDAKYAASLNIAVCNVRDYGSAAVAQHTIALMLSLTNRIADYQQAVRDGRWTQSPWFCLFDFPIIELAGKTLAIIGGGSIGQTVGRIAESLGMKVIFTEHRGQSPRPGRVDFTSALGSADVISLHCPLTEKTHHLLSDVEFALMKPGALLVNTARGGLVNEAALHDALIRGHLGGAALDVLSIEPPPADHILLDKNLPNLILTAHVAWITREARQRIVDQLGEIMRHLNQGTILQSVNGIEKL